MNHSELLDVGEVADLLRLKESTIRSWILKRKIAFVRMGRRVFVRRMDCDEMIAANLVLPGSQYRAQGATQ